MTSTLPAAAYSLPSLELRQRMLARATLTLDEARALMNILDQLPEPAVPARGSERSRSMLGFHPAPQAPMPNV